MENSFDEPVIIGRGMRGGALVGKGVYGCVFKPAPMCAGGRVFKEVGGLPAVGKISDRSLGEEVGVGRLLMSLPLAKNYFAVPVAECTPATPIADPDARKCDVLRDAGYFTKLYEAVMPEAGLPLTKWAEDLTAASATYENLFAHLLEGMILYQNAGIVHNDIHWGNILVDSRGVARFIDFGLAFRPAEVRSWSDTGMGKEFKPQYVWQAPEIHVARMYMGRHSVREGVAKLKEKSEEYAELERAFPRRLSLEAAMTRFLTSVDQTEAGLAAYLRRYAVRLDWWRIGLCMWQLWMDMVRDLPDFRMSQLYRERRGVMMRILGGMTDFDPMTRMSPKEALAMLRPGARLSF